MRRTNILVVLALSNLALVAACAWLYQRWRAGGPQEETAVAAPQPAPLPSPAAPLSSPLRVVKTNVLETNAFRWSQLETDDYRAFIERLRAIGCPEQTIRDLIIADVDKLFAQRVLAANPAAQPLSYWQADAKELETGAEYRERQRQQREIDFAKRQVLRDLLGLDLVAERNKAQGVEDRFGRRLGFLSDDKRTQVRMILEQNNDAELDIRQKTWEEGEPLTDEDKARLKALQEERDQAIAKVLNPTELGQYQLAMSPLAYEVRDSLFGMDASELEYLTIYRLQKGFQQQWTQAPPEDPQEREKWEQAVAELQAQLKEKLGESRYAEYKRAQDPDYRQLAIAAARYKVPANMAAEVYEYKQAVLEFRARLTSNRSLTASQQQAALEAMAVETEQTVRAALGERAYQHYLRSGQGTWIQGAEQ